MKNKLKIQYNSDVGINEILEGKLRELLTEFNYTETGSTTELETGNRVVDFKG